MTKQNLFSFLLAFLVLGLCQVSTAQISIGVRGGISLNNMDVEPIDDDEPQPENILDFQFAVPVEIAIGDMFAVQPEIMFASHGFKQSDNSTATEGGFTSRTNYNNELKVRALEVPVLGKVKFGPENIKFHVLAGPSFGFGIGGEGKVKGDVEVTDVGGVVVFIEN